MPKLVLESATDVLDLDAQLNTGTGVQVHSGVSGLGLPAVSTQWLEGAGDGGVFRGSRVLPRDIDLPLTLLGNDRAELEQHVSRLALMLSDQCTLRLVEDDGSSWFTVVRRIGGGQYLYGQDTDGLRELTLVVTLRAGDPYWTAGDPRQQTLTAAGPRGLLPKLSSLKLKSSQTIGNITFDNPGNADAYPTWFVSGPGQNFVATSPTGEVLRWEGVLLAGDNLTIDTRKGTVVDQDGVNRYADLSPAPRMWRVPPGITSATAALDEPAYNTYIAVTWRPRKWMVV